MKLYRSCNESIKLCLSILLCACLSFGFLSPEASLAAEDGEKSVSTVTTDSYNIMLLIDKSGSMNRTDPDQMALSAACQFVEQMKSHYENLSAVAREAGRAEDSPCLNVGVMSFGGESRDETEIEVSLRSLDSEANVNFIKSGIQGIEYARPNKGRTDLGEAVYGAVEFLGKQAPDGQKHMIVLFTDGYSERVLNPERSNEKLGTALEKAKELSCEIYIVGLNHNDSIEEEGKKEIYSISDRAQLAEGIEERAEDDTEAVESAAAWKYVNYKITDNLKDVRRFYGSIFAKIAGSRFDFIYDHTFNVVSEGILAADIMVCSDEPIREVTILDPSGNEMEEDGDSFTENGDRFYRVLRIKYPQKGKWKVYVTTEDETYLSYVVQFYGVEASFGVGWESVGDVRDRVAFEHFEPASPAPEGVDGKEADGSKPAVGRVTAVLMDGNGPCTDPELLGNITIAEFDVRLAGDVVYPDPEMDPDSADTPGGSLLGTGSLTFNPEANEFKGYFPAEQGKEYEITVRLGNENMERSQICHLTVNAGSDAEDSTHESNVNEAGAESAGPGTDGEVIPKDWSASIKDFFRFRNPAARCWLLAVLFVMALALYLIRNWLLHSSGIFTIKAEINYTSESSSGGTSVERAIGTYPHGRQFSLWNLLSQMIHNMDPDTDGGEKAICGLISEEKGRIRKIKLTLHRPAGGGTADYRLNKDGRLLNPNLRPLSQPTVCYHSNELTITVSFKNVWKEGTPPPGVNQHFGKLASVPAKGKKRAPSGKKR